MPQVTSSYMSLNRTSIHHCCPQKLTCYNCHCIQRQLSTIPASVHWRGLQISGGLLRRLCWLQRKLEKQLSGTFNFYTGRLFLHPTKTHKVKNSPNIGRGSHAGQPKEWQKFTWFLNDNNKDQSMYSLILKTFDMPGQFPKILFVLGTSVVIKI